MADLRTYDPKKVIVTVGGVPMSGYADGTFISVERDNDTWSKVSGADGAVSRAKSNDRTGTLTLTLQQTSPSNDVLSGFARVDEISNDGVVPISVTDLGGRTVIFSAFGWVQKPPTVEMAKEISNREWVLALADVEFFVGGNASTSGPLF
jgi:hypothetical protein